MGKDRLLWSNTSKLSIFSNLTDYGLSGHKVFDHDQIRPAGKMYFRTQSCNKLFYGSICMTYTIWVMSTMTLFTLLIYTIWLTATMTKWLRNDFCLLRNVSVCYVRIPSWLREWVIIRKRFAIKRADSNWLREIDKEFRVDSRKQYLI